MNFGTAGWRRFVYTLWAPIYDVFAWPFAPLRRRSIEKLLLRAGEQILIVGAGTGLDLGCLPRDVAITAVDLTPAMLARLRRRARRLGLEVDARVMDAQSMAFADGSFDAVILHLILAVVPDPVACIREVARVLRDGGRAVIFDKFLPDCAQHSKAIRLLAPVVSCFGTEISRRLSPILDRSGLRVASDEPAMLGGLFRIVRVEKHPSPGCGP